MLDEDFFPLTKDSSKETKEETSHVDSMAPNLEVDLQSEELGQVKDGHVVFFFWLFFSHLGYFCGGKL